MKKIILMALFLVSFLYQQSFAEVPKLWGNLKPGPYAVGFKVKLQYDYSRTFQPKYDFEGKPKAGPRARPIQTLIWYPTNEKSGDAHLFYRDYVVLRANELKFDPPSEQAKQQSIQEYIQSRTSIFRVTEQGVKTLLSMETAAIANASPATGKFPLLIYAPGSSGSAFENAVFCEYLASQGYIVAALPSMGAYSRQATIDLTGFYAYMQDIEFVIGSMHDFPGVDPDKLALSGFSMGGSAATLVQMRNTDIDAVVYLDTGIAFSIVDTWFKPSNYYDLNNLRAAQLYLTRNDVEGLNRNFLDQIHYANSYSVMYEEGYKHQDFMSEGMFAGVVPNYLAEKHPKDPKLLFETVCQQSHHFLDAYVKKDDSKLKFLESKPEAIGLRAGFFNVEHKKALTAPPRETEIAEMVRTQRSVERIREIYAKAIKENPGVSVFREATMNELGYEFLFRGNAPLAIDIFKLNVEAFPKSANTYDSLAEAYEGAGKTDLALEFSKKAIELLKNDKEISEQRRALILRGAEERVRKLEAKAQQ
jgi:tetratricopeptide (TPR) repeat protein